MPSRLFVASLGNPAPYTNTLHSAGHTFLESLRILLNYPPFTRNSDISPGLFSHGPLWTLYQSPSYMNASGPAVAKAYSLFLRTLSPDERNSVKLVVVHDELELPLGSVKTKVGGSAKGHNGLKSCIGALSGMQFIRMGVGIGRPENRDSASVSAYVLRKMTGAEKQKIHAGVENARELLHKINDG